GALAGLASAIPHELPFIDCRHIDLDDVPKAQFADQAAAVVDELAAPGDVEVAYRQGRRLVPKLERVDLRREPPAPQAFQAGGLYLLTGGLGGIGGELTRFLVSRCGARVLLVGRSPLPEQSPGAAAASPHAESRLQAYQAL